MISDILGNAGAGFYGEGATLSDILGNDGAGF